MQKSGKMVEGIKCTQILRQEKCSQNSKKASVATAETIKEKTDKVKWSRGREVVDCVRPP